MRQKNFTKEVIRIVFYILLMVIYITLVPPSNIYSIIFLYILLSVVLFAVFKPIFRSLPSRIIPVVSIVFYLILRQNRLENIINTILLIAIVITLEIYFIKV